MGIRARFLGMVLMATACGALAWAEDSTPTRALVQLDGSGSQDADGDRLVYEWKQVEGPKIDLIDADSANPKFYATRPGLYRFRLVVSDGKARSEPAFVDVVVEKANLKPIALAPKEIKTVLGESVTIDGSRSFDHDNDALTYSWRQVEGPRVILDSRILRRPALSFTPPREGTYLFELVVNDGRDESEPVRCSLVVVRPNIAPIARVRTPRKTVIHIQPENTPPVASTSGNMMVRLGEVVVLRGEARDADNDSLQYLWKQTAGPEVLRTPHAGETYSFTPKESGVYIFELIVSDGKQASVPSVCAVTVVDDEVLSMEGSELHIGDVRIQGAREIEAMRSQMPEPISVESFQEPDEELDPTEPGFFSRMFGKEGAKK